MMPLKIKFFPLYFLNLLTLYGCCFWSTFVSFCTIFSYTWKPTLFISQICILLCSQYSSYSAILKLNGVAQTMHISLSDCYFVSARLSFTAFCVFPWQRLRLLPCCIISTQMHVNYLGILYQMQNIILQTGACWEKSSASQLALAIPLLTFQADHCPGMFWAIMPNYLVSQHAVQQKHLGRHDSPEHPSASVSLENEQ